MSDLTDKFTTLETQLAEQQTAMMASLSGIADVLGLLNTALDTLNSNGALNTKYLLAAIGQNSPCMPCPTPPLVIPPTGTTPIDINPEGCQRSQAFIHFMQEVFTVLDVASSVGVGFSPMLITDAFNQVIASLSGGDAPNPPSFPEAVQLVGELINYVALNLLRGATLTSEFAPLIFDLRDVMYSAGTPAAAQSAYASVVNAAGTDSDIKRVFIAAAYNDAFSYFFDPASTPDLAGFDDSVCSFPSGTCYTLEGTSFLSSPGGFAGTALADIFGPFSPVATISTTDVDQTFTPGIFYPQDPDGWTYEVLIGHATIQYRAEPFDAHTTFSFTSPKGVDGTPSPMPASGVWAMGIDTGGQVRICKT